MEQFLLVPLFAYNNSANTPIVTKQGPAKYKREQNPTYHKETTTKKLPNSLPQLLHLYQAKDWGLLVSNHQCPRH